MTNRNPTFYRTESAVTPAGWGGLAMKIIAIVFAAVMLTLAARPAFAQVRQAVVNDPTSATAQDVRPLIANDLDVYLVGGESSIGWSMHRVTATALAEDFRANEVAAQRRYGDGADLVITGKVRTVSVTISTPTVNLALPVGQVPAMMAPGHEAWLESLQPGQRVAVACRRVRAVLTMVGAFQCEPRAAYVKRMTDAYFYSMHGLAKGGDKMAARLLEIAAR